MDHRYNEVKVLLKNWEQSFVQEHQRKPNKEDIDGAQEETKRLYKEYRSLKVSKENSSSQGASELRQTPAPTSAEKEADCWGSHLNRRSLPATPPTLTPQDHQSLQASAQYYGMKLKTNLGTLTKERPLSLRKGRPPGPSAGLSPGLSAGRSPAGTPVRTPGLTPGTPVRTPGLTPGTPVRTPGLTPGTPVRTPGLSAGLSAGRTPLRSWGDVQSGQSPNTLSPLTNTCPDPPLANTCPAPPLPRPANTCPAPPLANTCPAPPLANTCPAPPLTNTCPAPPLPWPANTCPAPPLANTCPDPPLTNTWPPPPLANTCPAPPLANTCPAPPLPRPANLPSPGPQQQEPSDLLPAYFPLSPAPRGRGRPPLLRPSLTTRLSAVDSGWLQRCQVFGEVEEGERPVVGNLNLTPSSSQAGCPAGTALSSSQASGAADQAEETRHTLTAIAPGNARKRRSTAARKPQKRGRGGEGEGGGGQERTSGKEVRKRGRSAEEQGEEEEEGKRKRRRTKRSQIEDSSEEEEEGVKPTVPAKVPQENLLGEVDEEDVRAARTRTSKPAGPSGAAKNCEGNFVKINLKKKSHVKGFALRGAALRKQMYMQKFQLKGERFGGGTGRGRGGFSGFSRQGDSCYRCGGTGHWARDCRGPAPPPSAAAEEEPAEEVEPFQLPTLEEVARATGTLRSEPLAPPSGGEQPGEEVLLNVIRPDYERPAPPPPMEPLYSLGGDGKVQAAPAEVYDALKAFGYQNFRPGQESAIMRILSGLSTLVVLSTGLGKSLCYQLPAFLYAQRSSSITLVVSPLVSLMDDQLSGLPAKLKAACIHSNMSKKQREAAIEKVKSGQVHVLLLSPEALVGGGHSGSGCLPPADQLPPVAFACIDEAHCVSEWSHNFRPCYLRLCKVLRDRLGVRCLLGLTATATLSTALDIARHLDISDQDGIAIRSAAVPDNLQLSVSTDRDKDQALVCLLKGQRFGCLDSVIVYCTRREETSRISALLRTCLQGVLLSESAPSSSKDQNPVEKKKKALAKKKVRKPLKWMAESYHAGMSAAERRRVQNNFMCGALRVVVATVAFGMGLDKSDVRGIVHYNMPKSFESYVQEIGRAGRDGEPAHCHLFLDPEGGDLHELRRHIYSDTVDYYSVKRLVQKVFPACKCSQIHKQQQLATEVEDSELLELMDICDQAAGPEQNPPAEQVEQSKLPAEARDGPLHLPAEGGQREPEERIGPAIQEEEMGKQEVEHAEQGSDRFKVEEKQPDGDCDWPSSRVCHTHERAIPIQETVEALDVTEEGLETLLCYLELHSQQWVELLHPTLACCRLVCYGGPAQIRTLTRICPPVAVVLARKRMAGERVETCDSLEFDVVEVADTMGWQLPLVKRGLRQLQWSTERAGGRSGVLVEFSKLSFYLRSYGDLSPEEMDRVCDFLQQRVVSQERTQLFQLSESFRAFRSVAYRSVSSCVDELEKGRSLQLKCLLGDYFDKRRDMDLSHAPTEEEDETLSKFKLQDWEEQIRADIRSFLANRSDERFSGRAVARILHGIGSPCYPAQVYGRDRRYWRKYIQFDFNQIIRWATQEIIRFK